MPQNYAIRDRSGQLLRTVPNVLDHVELTSVSVTSGSNIVTVASTTGLYPGMALRVANLPRGSFIHAIKSNTEIEVYCSTFNASTGVWTTSAANAQATASASSMKGYAMGFSPVPVTEWYAEGNWRNIMRAGTANGPPSNTNSSLSDGAAQVIVHGWGPGFRLLPTAGTVATGIYTPTTYEAIKDDTLQATPVKRHEGVPRGVWMLVSAGGHITTHQINVGDSCGPASA